MLAQHCWHVHLHVITIHHEQLSEQQGGFRRVSAENAPEKALRSLMFLITTIRELGYAVAKTGGEAPLEASVLEAAFQVYLPFQKQLFVLCMPQERPAPVILPAP